MDASEPEPPPHLAAVELRPFPEAAQQLFTLLANPRFSMAEVEQVIDRDQALAAKTLELANSAIFGTVEPAGTIRASVTRLGSQTVQELVAAVVVRGMFRDVQGVGVAINEHSAGVSLLLRLLSRWRPFKDIPYLFIAGLLHDVGKLLILQAGEFDYTLLNPLDLERPDRVHLREREQLGFDHAALGGHAARRWRMPDPVPTVIALHHRPARAFQVGGAVGIMVALVRIADVAEYLLSTQKDLDPALTERLVRRPEFSHVDFGVSDLKRLWRQAIPLRGRRSSAAGGRVFSWVF